MLFDSHCHLTDDRLRDEVDDVVARAREVDVTGMVTIGADPDDFNAVVELAGRFEEVWAAVGVHPHIADRADAGVMERVRELAGQPRVVAIGETGLDYYYDNAPRATQRRAFERHVALAAELGAPLIVHAREADEDTVAVLREAGSAGVRGVVHCFTGGAALLDAALEEGWHISFAGVVSFHNYDGADRVRAVPDERLLIETDSPYLAPVPRRGKRNEPAFVRHVAEAVAELRETSFESIAERTARNARAFYGIGE